MKVVGFNIDKISAEKISNDFKELKIENNIQIEDIKGTKLDLFKKEEVIQANFTYGLNYNPNIAKILFSGNLFFLVDSKKLKKILKDWEEKKVSEELKFPLFNIILRKTNIKALELEDELNLPLHISFPSLKPQNKE